MSSLPTKLKKPPKFLVSDVLVNRGYIYVDGGGEYTQQYFPPGTTRGQIKQRAVQPVLKLRYREVEQIQEWANTEDDVLMGAMSFYDKGMLPDPIQERIDAAAKKRTAELEARMVALEKLLAEREMAKEKAEDERLLAEEKKAAAVSKEPEAKPAKAK